MLFLNRFRWFLATLLLNAREEKEVEKNEHTKEFLQKFFSDQFNYNDNDNKKGTYLVDVLAPMPMLLLLLFGKFVCV